MQLLCNIPNVYTIRRRINMLQNLKNLIFLVKLKMDEIVSTSVTIQLCIKANAYNILSKCHVIPTISDDSILFLLEINLILLLMNCLLRNM